MNALSVQGLVKSFGGIRATDNLDLDIRPGEIHAIIGPNGAGKTTLINQLSGELLPSSGSIHFGDVDVTREPMHRRVRLGIARSYQITSIFLGFTALQNVMLAVQGERGETFSFWRPVAADERLVASARALLERVGLSGFEHILASAMAHGAKRQLELAMTLALNPKVMLLDEPMAGMSHHETEGMIALLARIKRSCSIVLIEHDMDAVFALADRITVVVYGRPIATGTPEEIRNNADVRDAYLGDQEELA
ncbi:MAG: branched-chain amino acid transporter,ATP-binding component [Rhizobium sp.]|nr:branched-chain amino acid transporter,ATP-binding component [Rhizobium sp.]